MNPIKRAALRWLQPTIAEQVRLAVQVTDDPSHWRQIAPGPSTATPWYLQRAAMERATAHALNNPMAARLVAIVTDHVLGTGPVLTGAPWHTAFWQHPLNNMPHRAAAWCAELTTTGELFVVLSRHPADRMSYARLLPALTIDQIETDPNDSEHELRYHQLTADPEGIWWPAHPAADQPQVVAHFAINRPPGQVRGTSDFNTVLDWLDRYDMWLQDRVRLNRFRTAYVWQVKITEPLPGELAARQAALMGPPSPGSLIFTDARETWVPLAPPLGSEDVSFDGKALRLIICAGFGVPLHFLSESEEGNRSTAEAAAAPALRHLRSRQALFADLLATVTNIAAERAGQPATATVTLPPITAAPVPTGDVEARPANSEPDTTRPSIPEGTPA